MLDIEAIQSFYPENLRPFKKNILREYLQYKILEAVFDSPHGQRLCFMGGTAAHIVYQNARFSEDLDFDNLGLKEEDFRQLTDFIRRKLNLEGYRLETKTVFEGAYRCYLKIFDILFESGISKHRQEKLLIQIDAEPQGFGYDPDSTILNKFDVFSQIRVVPVDILLSQKISAIFGRKRVMGRDLYDTTFLFGRTKPNFEYLNSKLGIGNMADLKARLLLKCKDLDLDHLARDVQSFLFGQNDAKKVLLFPEYLKSL